MASSPDTTKNTTWRLFALALVFALLAGIGTILYLNLMERRIRKELQPPKQSMTSVVVASRNLSVGTKINTDTVAVRKVPTEFVGPDSITPAQFNSINGAILVKQLGQGKILLRDFIDLNIPKDFSGTIREGHRAVTIQVDEINSVSGLVRPGNHIDLFTRLSGNSGSAGGQASSGFVVPVLENVLVLATGSSSARANEDEYIHIDEADRQRQYNTLTLELTPKAVALLSIAESRGTLIAALRNGKDHSGALFERISLQDLLAHSRDLLADAVSKEHNRSLQGIHKNAQGQLVTADGTVIKDPDVHLNKAGLLVTKDGKVLSGRNLVVGSDGLIHTPDGKIVDTTSLVAGKDGTLIDKNGNVLDSNGYHTTRNGFLVDKKGRIMTPDGHVLTGLHVDKDGLVKTADGRVIKPGDLIIDKDGTVRLKSSQPAMTIAKDGTVKTTDGKTVAAKDLVTVDPDGVVRTKDGTVLKSVHMGKDGQLYDKDGRKMSAADVLLAEKGYKAGKDGTVIDKNGNVLHAKDLVTVGSDGVVRTRDGKILKGVTMGKDGVLRDANGNPVTAQDIVERSGLADEELADKGTLLSGVTAVHDPTFAASLGRTKEATRNINRLYNVEYIIGGSSSGAAKTFMVQVEEEDTAEPMQKTTK